jgi:putative transposase
MARIARLKVSGEPAVYHLISRTTLEGFVLGDVEKDYLLGLIRRLSGFYFAEVLGFCLMGNHFHLLVRMHPDSSYSDEEVRERYDRRYREEKAAALDDDQVRELGKKMADLSEYVKEIKQDFSRYYNKLHRKKGFLVGAVQERYCGKRRNAHQLSGLYRSQPCQGGAGEAT